MIKEDMHGRTDGGMEGWMDGWTYVRTKEVGSGSGEELGLFERREQT